MTENKKFACEICDFSTNKRQNYDSHMKTKSHKVKFAEFNKKKLGKNFACEECGVTFNHRSNLYRHKKDFCKELHKKDEHNKKTSNELTSMQMLDKALDVLKTQASIGVTNAETIKETIHKSINMMSYAVKKFGGAPPMKSICDDQTKALKLIEIQGEKDPENNDEREEDIVIRHYNNSTLDQFFGEILKSFCCNENPNERFIWKTDLDRLNFIVKFEGVQNKSAWVRDENGQKIKETMLIPFFKHVGNVLRSYLREINKIDENDTDKQIDISKKTTMCLIIANEIITDTFCTKVLKYIGPSLKFDVTMMDKYDTKEKINFDLEKSNTYIYDYIENLLKDIPNITIFSNDLLCTQIREQVNEINMMVKNDIDKTFICIYYKSHQNKLSIGEINGLKNAVANITFNKKPELQFTKVIPLIISNNSLTPYEVDILCRSKVQYVTLSKELVRKTILSLLKISDPKLNNKSKKVLSDDSNSGRDVSVKIKQNQKNYHQKTVVMSQLN